MRKHIDYAHKIELQVADDNMDLSLDINRDICYASYKNYAIRPDGNINKSKTVLDTWI